MCNKQFSPHLMLCTCQPKLENFSATASPMPELAPVITAVPAAAARSFTSALLLPVDPQLKERSGPPTRE